MGFTKGQGGRPKGAQNKTTPEIREFAQRILGPPTGKYWTRVKDSLEQGTLNPQLEAKLWAYAYGEPKQDKATGDRIVVNLGFLGTAQPNAIAVQVIDRHAPPASLENITPPTQVQLSASTGSEDAG
jgi:hypothetical protein